MTRPTPRPRRLAILSPLLLALAACGPQAASRADSAAGASAAATPAGASVGAGATATRGAAPAALRIEGPAYVFACPDGYRFSARVRGDTATVTLPAQVLTLSHIAAASGAKYEGSGATFWSRGDSASLHTADVRRTSCVGRTASTPWEEARMLGIEFRGFGQEPGWILDVDARNWVRWIGDYGATHLLATIEGATRDSAVGTLTYAVKVDGRRDLGVEIRPGTCRDAMSGEAFTHAVTVRVDGKELKGCGRALPTDDVVGRYWKLVELDGKPAVGGPQATGPREPHLLLRGSGTQAVGATGCNGFRGPAELRGSALKLGPLAATRRACIDTSANRQERDYLRILGTVDRAAVSGDTLTLFTAQQPVARFVAELLR